MQERILCDSCRFFGTCHRSEGYAINCALYRPFEKPPKLRVYCRPSPSCADCVDFLAWDAMKDTTNMPVPISGHQRNTR